MRLKSLAYVYLVASLSACTEMPSAALPASQYDGKAILPVKTLKVGRVYRTATPTANTNGLPYIVQICPRDFLETPALAEIAKRYDKPDFVDFGGGYTATSTQSGSFGLGGLRVSAVDLGIGGSLLKSAKYEYKNIRRIDVSDEDQDLIRAKLGTECRKLISDWNSRGYDAFIVAGAWQAESITTTLEFKPEISADLKFKLAESISPGANLKYNNNQIISLSGSNQYFKVIPIR
jgi:hypothetical protein